MVFQQGKKKAKSCSKVLQISVPEQAKKNILHNYTGRDENKKVTSKAAKFHLLTDTSQVRETHLETDWVVMQYMDLIYSMFPMGLTTEKKVTDIPYIANIFTWQLCEHPAAQVS